MKNTTSPIYFRFGLLDPLGRIGPDDEGAAVRGLAMAADLDLPFAFFLSGRRH